MKVSKLLIVVVLVFTSFINLHGVIKTVELRSQTDESLLARFEFMLVEEFEKAIGKNLQGLCFKGLGWNAKNDYKVCRVRFENFGPRKIKIEESLRQLFSEYGKGPFSFKSPSTLMIAGPGIITAIVVCSALEIYFLVRFSVWVYILWDMEGHNYWTYMKRYGFIQTTFWVTIANIFCLLPCLCGLVPLCKWKFKNSKLIKQFSEREEVSEDGIIFFIKNEFLEQCSEMLERISLQVEEIDVDELFCRFTSPTEPFFQIGDYELRAIKVEEEEKAGDDEYSDEE